MTDAVAVVFQEPRNLGLERLSLDSPTSADVVVGVEWSGISTGTERLLWSGEMPPFPGMGYPLVPGYEAVGRVVEPAADAQLQVGQRVFVPGARCFGDVRGLFGAAASRLVVPALRVVAIDDDVNEEGVLLALAATAHHTLAASGARAPELIVGHGVLGRLLARIAVALGHPAPRVWERDDERRVGAVGYEVLDPADDDHRGYRSVYDVSGDASLVDSLIGRLAPRADAELVLAGFYTGRISFDFAPAFMREARIRIAAEWDASDMEAVTRLIADGELSLSGLITHREAAGRAPEAYETAFGDPHCLKMILEWRDYQ